MSFWRFWAIFRFVLKRTANNSRLLIASFIGLLVAVSLVSAVPLYTHGTLERLLRQQLDQSDSAEKRPAGAVWLRFIQDSSTAQLPLDRFTQFNQYLVTNIQPDISLPLQQMIRYVAGDTYVLWPAANQGFVPQNKRRYGYLVYESAFAKHIKIIAGTGAINTLVAAGAPVPALVSSRTADHLHLKVGEEYIYSDIEQYNPSGIIVQIVGIWEPINRSDPYWLYDPSLFDNALFVGEQNLFQRVFVSLPKAPHEFSWYALFDSAAIHTVNEDRVLSGLQFLQSRANISIPGIWLYPALLDTLTKFGQASFVLTLLLFVLSAPMLVVVLYYIATSVGMVLDRQRNEIALLKSRGASSLQIVGVYLCEGLILGGAALAIGPILGMGLAQLIGDSYGFLLFAQRPPLPLTLTGETIRYAVGAVGLSLIASLIPAAMAARHSIVSYKQEIARSGRWPIWQRFFLDVVLLAIALYGYRALRDHQSIASLTSGTSRTFVDPLVLVVPSVFIFAVGLLFLRIFPILSTAISALAARVGDAATLLALRQIARTPWQYRSLLLLLMLTLSLGAFSASAAKTLDRNFVEQVRYAIPADLELTETWDYDQIAGVFNAPPLSDHQVPGVVAISTFNSYTVTPNVPGDNKPGQLLAIDRLTYPKVGWWRRDFAARPLGALMNALGANESALLVQQSFLDHYQLHIGDSVTLLFDNTPVDFYVAETIHDFPTLYPEKGYIFVANLDYIYSQIGLTPYQVWLKVLPNARSSTIVDEIRARKLQITNIRDSRVAVNYGRLDPQRTGLFGILSIGFGVAALLTVLGFFLYSFLSFERRLLQMGVLRAMGLSVRQLFRLLMLEQVYLIILGVSIGTGLGIVTGQLFLPFFQVSTDAQVLTPSFVVETAWGDIGRIYIVLGAMLLVGLSSTAILIGRMRLYRTVKLGEET